jgi:hypothetical protein
MGLYRGPKIVKDGLVVALDAGSERSYPGTGSVWTDLKNRSGDNASLISSPVFSTEGKGSFLINTTDYASIPFDDVLFNPADHTIICWCKCNDTLTTANTDRVTLYKDNSNWSPGLWFHSTNLRVHLTGRYLDVPIIQDQEWHMMGQVYTVSGTDLKAILDGAIVDGTETLWTNGSAVSTEVMRLGNRGTASSVSQFRGYISTFMIYNRALSAAEIAQNYHAHKSRFI